MSPLSLVLAAVGLLAGAALVSLLLGRTPRAGTMLAALGAVGGGAVGLAGALRALSGAPVEVTVPWSVPGGALVVGLDPLSAFFLVPLFLLGALGAVYGRAYLGARVGPAAAFNGLLVAMALVLLARDALVLLVAWEVMNLLAFVLVTVDHHEADVRRAGWVYLLASHLVVVCLLMLFLVLGSRANGALDFAALARGWRGANAGLVLTLALVGFGVKAGVVGLHGWLPEAHAAAPSHVSAVMSAVLVKLGLYGLLRVTLLTPPGVAFSLVLMTLGLLGAFVGIALALGQRDLKRAFAYSTVENLGLILFGFGLGTWGRARGDLALATLGFGGALLHVWNHAAMKGLLFLGAGSVLHGAGTRDLERLGGLWGRMRWTSRAITMGAVAIAGLPPLNGFSGEWLLYRGLTGATHAAGSASALLAMAGAAALALVGGLAALAFVRVVGVALLGTPRSEDAAKAHESPAAMLAPMAVLAAVCVASAVAAPWLLRALAPVVALLGAGGEAEVAQAARLATPVALGSLALFVALALALALVRRSTRGAPREETWGCGYAAPTPRMQYTARSFAELVGTRALPRWLRVPVQVRAPKGPFPAPGRLASTQVDPFTRGVYEPLFARLDDRFARLRFLQQGNLHVYLLYVLATLVLGLAWVALWGGPQP